MAANSACFRSVNTRLNDSPLAPITKDYLQHLSVLGYAPGTQHHYLGCVAHFAGWMMTNRIPLHQVSSELVVNFIDKHLPVCKCQGKVQSLPRQVRAALRILVVVLQEMHIVTREPTADEVELELERFDAYQRDQRGLARNTRLQRRRIVGDLLRHANVRGRSSLHPIDITVLRAFLNERMERWSPASFSVLASATRAYLQYRKLQGDQIDALVPAVLSPACWRLSPLPETLTDKEVEQVLGSFEPPVPSRRRGLAVAQCVARLGLRASEVVELELDDLDWNAGTVALKRCKSLRVDVMPLLEPVGSAIVDYLQYERPTCKSRRVFVRHYAPVEVPLKASMVGRVIRDAYRRCRLPYTRVHIFRHSLAARVLDAGGSLKEVADVLRHRHLDTAQIYAKLDERRLSDVAMPWPGSES